MSKKTFIFSFISMLIFFSSVCQVDNEGVMGVVWIKNNNSEEGEKLFNNNGVINKQEKAVFKNALDDNSTIFLVFKANPKEKIDLATLKYGRSKVSISNKEINSTSSGVFELYTSDFGQIVSYSLNDSKVNLSSRNKIVLDCIKGKQNEGLDFLEFVMVPNAMSVTEIRKMETYLSIKYGISLHPDSVYVGVSSDTIWNVKDNEGYLNRVTGIGLNIMGEFDQLKSHNSQMDGVEIAFDSVWSQKQNLKEGARYFLWADNNGGNVFEENRDGSLEVFNKVWRYRAISDDSSSVAEEEYNIKVSIDKQKTGLNDKTENLRLAMTTSDIGFKNNALDNLILYPGVERDSSLVFSNVKVNGDGYFTLVRLPEMNLTYEGKSNCVREALYEFEIESGTQPYAISINNLKGESLDEFVVNEKMFDYVFEEDGSFIFEVNDRNGNSVSRAVDVVLPKVNISMPDHFVLNGEEELNIQPEVSVEGIDETEMEYYWYKDGVEIGSTKELLIKEKGDYELNVVSDKCDCRFPIEVEQRLGSEGALVKLVENPIEAGDYFELRFNLTESSSVDVLVTDLNGKVLVKEIVEMENNHSYRHQLENSGTYIVSVQSNELSANTFKIIVK